MGIGTAIECKSTVGALGGVNLSLPPLRVNDSPMTDAKFARLFQIKAAALPKKVENSISSVEVTIFA
jgi:hypothetical protein